MVVTGWQVSLSMQVPMPSEVMPQVQQSVGQLIVMQGSTSQVELVATQVSPALHCVAGQRLALQVTVVGSQTCPSGQYMPPQGSGMPTW